ncbi:hypothetical protein LAZ67_22000627 [Cordylochernes scorpioides]|uniref:Uncharacterized protein n=1 Tax=Cordylochernes scorpioides TaxID=51811 RepID=A0ABY6LNQ2_9ARAC|nr:hypothetical protein LAZ67_22000627 [Cordylochernes scorpioides]
MSRNILNTPRIPWFRDFGPHRNRDCFDFITSYVRGYEFGRIYQAELNRAERKSRYDYSGKLAGDIGRHVRVKNSLSVERLAKSGKQYVYLKDIDLNTAGVYRCEVSAEAPSFKTAEDEKEMKVYGTSTSDPEVFINNIYNCQTCNT